MKICLFFTSLTMAASASLAQSQPETAVVTPQRSTVVTLTERGPEEVAVRATINQMFDAMKRADSTAMKPLFLPGAKLQTVLNKQGDVSVKEDAIAGFIASVGKAKAGALDERLGEYVVHVDGDLATAFTPYQFYYNGEQHHCGANAFTLVRVGGAWKIQNIIDTRRKCL